jgi:hypothetical protein
VLDVHERSRPQRARLAPSPKELGVTRLETACRGLLQDIGEVIEQQGESWWCQNVTSGMRHRRQAEQLLGKTPYASAVDSKIDQSAKPSCE